MGSSGFEGGSQSSRQTTLRRALFGVRGDDVRRALASRDAEIEELRREIAALWQTYAQHDRAIREALAPPPEPDEGNGASADDEEAGERATAAERRAGIEAQLSGLDEALAAIEQATETLEQAYKPPAKSQSD